MKKKTLELLVEAQAELDGATEWYRARDRQIAQRFVAETRRAMASIIEAPGRWPRFEDSTRRKLVRGFPFAVIYCGEPTKIVVIAVAHTSRRPAYWHRR